MTKNIKILFLSSLLFIACSKEDDAPVVVVEPLTAGEANFSKYVALGNSLTAGFSDGALFKEGQKGSWTNILNEQFKLVGGTEFKIPFMPDDNIGGFLKADGTQDVTYLPRLYFQYYPTSTVPGAPSSGPLLIPQISTVANATVLTGEFNNMGIPGAKVWHLPLAGYGFANPYFKRFASNPMASILGDAVAQKPTFFSLWIGNNDVLSYATSGGSGVNQLGNVNPATYGPNDITDPTVFAGTYNSLVTQLTAGGAKGVIANIPDVTSVPFFTTVPTSPVPALPVASAGQLNTLFGAINKITTAISQPNRFINLTVDDNNPATVEATNPLLIVDETLIDLSAQITGVLIPNFGLATATFLGKLYGRARHAINTPQGRDYILLSTRRSITPPNNIATTAPAPFNVNGVSFPLQDGAVLTAAETAEIVTATNAYNVTISGLATSKGLAFVDTNALLKQIASGGVSSNGYTITNTYPTGGGFSLDGVHPSARGYALIANKFMEAINTTYKSNLKPVDISKYRVQYPKAF